MKVWRSLSQLWSINSARRKIIATPFSIIGLVFIYSWTLHSNSCALNAFLCLIAFDVVTLLADLVNQFYTHGGKPSTAFSFGFVRVEVLIHFSVLCFGILINVWAVKTSVQLVVSGLNEEIHTGRFLPAAFIGGFIHFFLSFNNNPFLKVSKVSCTYTSLQKYFQGICASFGLSLSSSSLFSHSPLAILGAFSISILIVLAFALQSGQRWIDFVGGILLSLGIFDAIWPLCVYTAQVLLQTVPSHIVTQLEKALREALTIDGVLEFRNELFWTLTYGQIAGTLHARVRRDANEQLVLSKVYEKLQPLAPHLTIQVTKDDFGRQFNTLQILRDVTKQPMTGVTINHPPDLSPIPTAHGSKHLIYSAASSTHFNANPDVFSSNNSYSAYPINSFTGDETVMCPTPRSAFSSTSSIFETPNVVVHDSNPTHVPSNPRYTASNGQYATGGHQINHHNNTLLRGLNVNSGVSSSNQSQQGQTNLLISSANFFPES